MSQTGTETKPYVSVITPHRDEPVQLETLKGCLEAQSFQQKDFEWIVVDDASRGGAPEWLSEYQGSIQLVPVLLKDHLGRAGARNRGIDVAHGRIIVFLDADMEPMSTWLKAIVEAVEKSNSVIIGRTDSMPGEPLTAFQRYYFSRGAAKLSEEDTVPGKYFVSGNSAMARSVMDEVGGFNEDFKTWGGEDLELGLRLEASDVRILREPEALAYNNFDRQWDEIERRYIEYGRYSVPKILELHPNAREMLSLDLVYPVYGTTGLGKKLRMQLIRFACHRFLYVITRSTVKLLPNFPWPDLVFDFMIFYLYSKHSKKIWERRQ